MTRRSFWTKARNTALSFSVTCLVSFQASGETLTDALISAYNTSGLLEQNRALLRAADEDVASTVAALRPIVNYVVQGGHVRDSLIDSGSGFLEGGLFGGRFFGSATVTAELLLYDFGATRLNVDIARETVLATREGLINVEQAVLLRAVSAFMNLRRDTANVTLRENNVRRLTEELRAARDRFEVGEVTLTDVSIAEARLASANSALAAARGAVVRSGEEYFAAVGRRAGTLQPPPASPQTATSSANAVAVGLTQHPEIRGAQRNVTVSELAIEAARLALRPTVTGSANLSIDEDGNDSENVTVRLSGPIYRGGAIASAIREAQARRDAARADLLETSEAVAQGIASAWADVEVARAVLVASDEQVRAARLALRGAQEELSVGARTTLEVLDREQELDQAETDRIDAELNRQIAVYSLLSEMGLLTVEHLGLGIPTYDPEAYFNAVKDAPRANISPQGERLDSLLKAIGQE